MAIFSQQKLAQLQSSGKAPERRHKVMIVDDKDANLSVMAAILRPHYEILEARDGQEALRLVEELDASDSLACIISDHRMPRLTGVEFFERIQPLLPRTIRIIVSGYIDVDAVVDSINKAEVYKFIVKPFDASDFLLTVNRAIESFELQQQFSDRHAQLIAENEELTRRNAELQALVNAATKGQSPA
jgi:response regulator RpfG family c-di-GMP phosphodiesterase